MVEQWNSGTVMVEQCYRVGGIVEQGWWNSGRLIMEQWKIDGGTVEQL